MFLFFYGLIVLLRSRCVVDLVGLWCLDRTLQRIAEIVEQNVLTIPHVEGQGVHTDRIGIGRGLEVTTATVHVGCQTGILRCCELTVVTLEGRIIEH